MLVRGGRFFTFDFDAVHHPLMRKFGASIEMVDDNTTNDQVSLRGKQENENETHRT